MSRDFDAIEAHLGELLKYLPLGNSEGLCACVHHRAVDRHEAGEPCPVAEKIRSEAAALQLLVQRHTLR